jgi:hypothetical protein
MTKIFPEPNPLIPFLAYTQGKWLHCEAPATLHGTGTRWPDGESFARGYGNVFNVTLFGSAPVNLHKSMMTTFLDDWAKESKKSYKEIYYRNHKAYLEELHNSQVRLWRNKYAVQGRPWCQVVRTLRFMFCIDDEY